jgi:hypothetical protein
MIYPVARGVARVVGDVMPWKSHYLAGLGSAFKPILGPNLFGSFTHQLLSGTTAPSSRLPGITQIPGVAIPSTVTHWTSHGDV